MTKKRSNDAGFSQIDLFGVSANVGSIATVPAPGAAHRCETCRHWHKNLPVFDRLTGKYTESKWHHCAELFVVTKREYGSPVEAGTVLTKEEYQASMLSSIDFLNTAPFFDCERWEEREEDAS